ncbi:hypothetical protein PRIPAC_83013 [Pristionchus pacificus]|uniref:Dehydrogenase n=1 Tax=Pristionchus pacificus TaxID=54126 RepID=A0A2A6CJS6_PRIPA|nr:hypothetical protein PRIPAC_83013 [Pristionchus pacificus]|eukprot:PDM78452.1 dehydrogenase [Pristionchus pacificus]
MSSVLVTGANRGIGLGITRHLLTNSSVATVIATARDVEAAKDLKALDSPKLNIIQLEVVNEGSIAKAAEKVAAIVGDNGLDVLINNAGIAVMEPLNGELSKAKIIEVLDVNAIGPLLIANKFYPLLKRAASKKGSAQIAMISSGAASLDNAIRKGNRMPYSIYGMSKAALNMLTRRLSVEWKDDNIRATTFCPGWVKTDMGTQAAKYTKNPSTMADFKPTPEQVEKFKAGRKALQANPTAIDGLIAKLSPAAQEPAKKFRDLVLSNEEDPAKFHAVAEAAKVGLSDEVKKELESHRKEVAVALGFA